MYSKAADYVVDTKNPDELDMDRFDEATFAVQFYDRLYSEVEVEGVVVPMQSNPLTDTVSPLVFIRGKLLNINELTEQYPEAAVKIVPQMEQVNCSHVVKLPSGFKPFSTEKDIFWKPKYKELYYERYPQARD